MTQNTLFPDSNESPEGFVAVRKDTPINRYAYGQYSVQQDIRGNKKVSYEEWLGGKR